MGKKKIVIVIAIVIILIGGGITTYVCLADSDREPGNVSDKTIETLDDVTEAMVEESPAENEELDKEEETDEEEKPETEKPEPDKEEQTQVTSGTAQTVDIDDKPASETQPVSQNTPSAPSAPASGQTDAPTQPETTETTETTEAPAVSDATDDTSEKTWVPAVYEDVWVVDQEAFSYENPIYETICLSICNGCGADITGNVDAHATRENLLNGCGGYHTEYVQVQVGTETIEVEEVGHWEKVLVSEGYWK